MRSISLTVLASLLGVVGANMQICETCVSPGYDCFSDLFKMCTTDEAFPFCRACTDLTVDTEVCLAHLSAYLDVTCVDTLTPTAVPTQKVNKKAGKGKGKAKKKRAVGKGKGNASKVAGKGKKKSGDSAAHPSAGEQDEGSVLVALGDICYPSFGDRCEAGTICYPGYGRMSTCIQGPPEGFAMLRGVEIRGHDDWEMRSSSPANCARSCDGLGRDCLAFDFDLVTNNCMLSKELTDMFTSTSVNLYVKTSQVLGLGDDCSARDTVCAEEYRCAQLEETEAAADGPSAVCTLRQDPGFAAAAAAAESLLAVAAEKAKESLATTPTSQGALSILGALGGRYATAFADMEKVASLPALEEQNPVPAGYQRLHGVNVKGWNSKTMSGDDVAACARACDKALFEGQPCLSFDWKPAQGDTPSQCDLSEVVRDIFSHAGDLYVKLAQVRGLGEECGRTTDAVCKTPFRCVAFICDTKPADFELDAADGESPRWPTGFTSNTNPNKFRLDTPFSGSSRAPETTAQASIHMTTEEWEAEREKKQRVGFYVFYGVNIKGHNEVLVESATLDDCVAACEEDGENCRSFDWKPAMAQCALSGVVFDLASYPAGDLYVKEAFVSAVGGKCGVNNMVCEQKLQCRNSVCQTT